MTVIPPPHQIVSTLEQLRAEVVSLTRSRAAYRGEAERQRDRADRLERRLSGALYELYGDWRRVNKEIPRA